MSASVPPLIQDGVGYLPLYTPSDEPSPLLAVIGFAMTATTAAARGVRAVPNKPDQCGILHRADVDRFRSVWPVHERRVVARNMERSALDLDPLGREQSFAVGDDEPRVTERSRRDLRGDAVTWLGHRLHRHVIGRPGRLWYRRDACGREKGSDRQRKGESWHVVEGTKPLGEWHTGF